MKKVIIVLVMLLVSVGFLCSESVVDFTGNDWITFTETEKAVLVAGVMMGANLNYELVDMFEEMEAIAPEAASVLRKVNNFNIQVGYVTEKVDEWYNENRQWDALVYIIIFESVGNLDNFYSYLENYNSMKEQGSS
jgi:hypothetical protein